jgi:PPM family protein phosphatase
MKGGVAEMTTGTPPFVYHAHTDVGRLREKNEDSHAEYAFPDGSSLVIVADGMGGHGHGEVASQIAVRVIGEVFGTTSGGDPRERLRAGFVTANQQIIAESKRIGAEGMGTTCVAAYIRGTEAWVAHIGDSRIYHVREGRVVWRTTDHTRVQKMVEMGLLAAAQAKDHPDANVVTRALGYSQLADGTIIEPDVRLEPLQLQPGDSLVLCSDGLYDDVEDHEIGEAMRGRAAAEAAEFLVTLSNGRSGHDNITCTVLHFAADAGAFNPATRPTTIQAAVQAPPADLPRRKSGGGARTALILLLIGIIAAGITVLVVTQMT